MEYTPLNDYVIVQKMESSNTTASGIIIQSSVGSDKAKVIAVSKAIEQPIKVNDVVMIRWSNALKIDGDTYAVDFKEIVTKLA
jgi:co-chaperonin GroES (HSP10)